ncbi:MAG: PDZ domain-containing protein [Gemmataceae bacterium]|nr:PDZ domain-containing protein [Gemmataceae bacterium]
MFTRFFLPSLLALALVTPAFAQPKGKKDPTPAPKTTTAKTTPAFLALFAPAIEKASKSTVRLLVDGKDAALGVVVSAEGFVITKASEIKSGVLTVKTRDGRDLDAKVSLVSEAYDLALVKVEGSGLSPIDWASSQDAPVGNWVAIPAIGKEPVSVGVVSTGPRSFSPPYGPPRVPTEKSGFLGVQLDQDSAGATIYTVTVGSAAEKAGILPKDTIIKVDAHEIANQETLINTLLGYKAGDKVKIMLIREGKQMELTAVLGARPSELLPPAKGKGPAPRGDIQNSMGSVLSERRTGFPRIFQTDAVLKPTDCGAPLVDLDGRVLGIAIARAGRTESHVIPAETIKDLLPVFLANAKAKTPSDRVKAARVAIEQAEKAKVAVEVIAEGKRQLVAAETEEKWWQERPIEKGPKPRTVNAK